MKNGKKQILLVEDEAIIALAERSLLESNGYSVRHVLSGEAAIKVASQFDLILMDFELGRGLNGVETARRILLERDVPIIFLTSWSPQEMYEKAGSLAHYGCVLKNSSKKVMLQAIESVFKDAGAVDHRRVDRADPNLTLRDEGGFSYQPESGTLVASEGRSLLYDVKALFPHNLSFPHSSTVRDSVASDTPEDLKYRLLVEKSGDVIWLLDVRTRRFTYISPSVLRQRGFSVEEALAQSLKEAFTSESAERVESELLAPSMLPHVADPDDFEPKIGRYEQPKKDGSVIIVEVATTVVMAESQEVRQIVGISRDITARVRYERQREELLRAKDALLREIYVRFKKNVNVLAGLFSLEAASIADVGAISALNKARARLVAMSTLYDKLASAPDFHSVSVREYLSDLLSDLVASGPGDRRVSIESYIEDFRMNSKQLFFVGVIVQELVSRARESAFPEGCSGSIVVTLCLDGAGVVELIVSDDGIAARDEARSQGGFDLQLVRELTKHLPGTVDRRVESGTTYRIRFAIEIAPRAIEENVVVSPL